MVKLQDFVIAGLLVFSVILGSVLFFGEGAKGYGLSVENASFVNTSSLNELIQLTKEVDEDLAEQESGTLDNLAKIFRRPIAAIKAVRASIGILFEFFGNVEREYGIPTGFVSVIIAILTIIFGMLFIAALTGRFV